VNWIVAQVAAADGTAVALLTYGPLGAFCTWFMLAFKPEMSKLRESIHAENEATRRDMRSLAHRINGQTQAQLVDTLTRVDEHSVLGRYAKKFLSECDAVAAQEAAEQKARDDAS